MFATTSASAIFAAPARLRAPAPRSVSARPVCRATNGNGSYVNPLRPSESPEQAAARRERETARVRERTKVRALGPRQPSAVPFRLPSQRCTSGLLAGFAGDSRAHRL